MTTNELAVEMNEFLNEKGLYVQFLAWADKRGFDESEVEEAMESLIED